MAKLIIFIAGWIMVAWIPIEDWIQRLRTKPLIWVHVAFGSTTSRGIVHRTVYVLGFKVYVWTSRLPQEEDSTP